MKAYRRNKITLACIYLLTASVLYIPDPATASEEINLEISTDKTNVKQGEKFTLTILVSGNYKKTPELKMPDLKDFLLVSQNQYSSYTIKAGKIQAKTRYELDLLCKEEGKFTIGSAELNYQGKVYKTQPTEIMSTPNEDVHQAPQSDKIKGTIL